VKKNEQTPLRLSDDDLVKKTAENQKTGHPIKQVEKGRPTGKRESVMKRERTSLNKTKTNRKCNQKE